MKLREYTKFKLQPKVRTSEIRTICVTRKDDSFTTSVRLAQDLGLLPGQRILIARDEDSKNDWYVTFGDKNLPGSSKLTRASKEGKNLYLRAVNRAAAADLLDSICVEKSATFMIAIKPTMIEGKAWYRIMTANPVRIV